MKRYVKILFSLLLGLITVEILASIQVHRAMIHLAGAVLDVIRAGYLITVPNALIHGSLVKTGMAVYGGLFYTLTVGALLSTVSLGAAFLLLLFPERTKILLALFASLLAVEIVSVNQHGFLPIETVSLVLAPILVCGSAWLLFRKDVPVFSLKAVLIHGMPPVMLAFVLVFFVLNGKSDLFSDFRDAFLLSNPVGMKINDFYYQYTMAPAEVFKSLDQKLVKTCVFEPGSSVDSVRETIGPRLLAKDYAVLDSSTDPDLTIRCAGDKLVLLHHNRPVSEKSMTEFMANSPAVLTEFSKKTDRYQGYRLLIRTALLSGLPLLMYILIHAVFFFFSRMLLPGPRAAMAASFAVPFIGIVSFTVLYASSEDPVNASNLQDHLSSPSLMQRVDGLKFIENHHLNMEGFPDTRRFMESPSVLEKYWYARALSGTRTLESFLTLVRLADDPHPNVRCQAFFALGASGNPSAIPVITGRMRVSHDWYEQFYGYMALKRLGWNQQK